MIHTIRRADLIILGGVTLFTILVALFALDTDITGRATSTVNITNSTPVNCTVSVLTGLNTVAFPCILLGEARTNVVPDTDLLAMYQYVPGTSDVWKVHNPNLPGYVVSDLQFLSRRAGYVFIMNGPQTYIISGFNVTSTNIPMALGWNLVGYPRFVTENVSTAFAGIDNYTEARTYDNPGGTYLSYINPSGGTLTEATAGQGYWINATQPLTWTVVN